MYILGEHIDYASRSLSANQMLTAFQSGLVTYCALMTTTMHKHGGVHQWDLTLADAREAVYVRNHFTVLGQSPAKILPSGSTLHQWNMPQSSFAQN